jgi:bifunctional non-homologous end joining protein LigD
MRLRLIAKPFDDPDYIFELKHDGFRALAYIDAGECKLVSRNLNHFKSFESLKKSLDKLPVQNAILDGEIVCLDSQGVSQFNELFSRRGRPVFYAFDLLWLDGKDFRGLPFNERKQSLRELIKKSGCERLIYAQHIETEGIAFFEEICARDLEGIVCKKKLSIYKSSGTGWLKVKNANYSQSKGRHDLFKARGRETAQRLPRLRGQEVSEGVDGLVRIR